MKTAENKRLEKEYLSRINKVIDYIEINIDKQFSLEELASVASFSKYHFHRIFYGVTGETPFNFIQRLRLERAASLLSIPSNESITEIAYRSGFTDISIFSRNFKLRFEKSPTQFRKEKNSNLSQLLSNTQQKQNRASMYFCFESQTIKWRTKMKLNKSVEVKELPKMTVAYIRHTGPYKGDEKLFERLWNKLFTWAGPRGLLTQPGLKSMVFYHDDLHITPEDKLRMSVSISVPPDTPVDGEIGKMEIEGGKYVIARFEVNAQQFGEAWGWVYSQWLPSSGYQPDDKLAFEMYTEEPKNGIFPVDICVPVKPL